MSAPVDRCAILDELERAIALGAPVALALRTGAVIVDRPRAITARDGDDRISLAGGGELAVGALAAVGRIR